MAGLMLTTAAPALEAPSPLAEEQLARASARLRYASDSEERLDTRVLAPVFRFSYRLMEWLEADAEWGFAWLSLSPEIGDSTHSLVSSNLMLGAAAEVGEPRASWRSARLSLGAPLALLADEGTDRAVLRAAHAYALSAYRFFDAWLWAPEQITMAAQGAFYEAMPGRREVLAFGLEAGLGGTIPFGDPDVAGQIITQAAAEVTLGRAFRFGPRLQAVWLPLSELSTFQAAVGLVTWFWPTDSVKVSGSLMIMPGGPARAVTSPVSLGLDGSFSW